MAESYIVDICKRCGKPIHYNEIYIEMIGDKKGPWHNYDCLKENDSVG